MKRNLPTATPTETIDIAPEYLEVTNTYLQCQDLLKTADDLGLAVDFVTTVLARREVRDYVNNVFFTLGFNNRLKMRSAMDAILKKKFSELEESQTGSTKDIADLMALSHKMSMEQLEMEFKIANAGSGPKSQVNVQINDTNIGGGAKYASLVERLIEANK